ncbi:MAG: winged helix-turn-helix domain-containing tetratricopeptide repeat protein [Pseudolabrys sp.]
MNPNEFSFGQFHLNTSQHELTRNGVPVPLGSRALDILCVLASAKGEVVSKDELMTRVWPRLVVEENNIEVHVSALRKVLDQRKGGQTHVVTVPGRGYRLVGLKPLHSLADGRSDGSLGRSPSEKPSIAVLPFQNMSGDPEQEYFADGMVDEIITGLSRIKWLSVTSRNSAFIYKHKPTVIREVADKFGVRYVLEGGVRKAGNRVRISAQLIDTANDAHLWAEQYDRVLEDVFALQDEITMCVVGAIEPSLRKAEIDRVRRQRPNDLNAYDLVLRSLPFIFAQTPKESVTAIPLLEDAVKLQPDYGAAHAYLGWCIHHRFRGEQHKEDRIVAVQHARMAISHGSDDATALAVAAHVIAFNEHDAATTIRLFDRALEVNNSSVFALSLSAIAIAWMGKSELAIERAERAIRLSPFDSYNFRSYHALAITYFYSQQYKAAVDAARRAIDYNPGFSVVHAVLAAALLRDGRTAEAMAAAREVLERDPTFTIRGVRIVAGELEPAVFKPFADAWREIGLPE